MSVMTPRDKAERDAIVSALNDSNGDFEVAAMLLKERWGPMSVRTLYRRIEAYQLRPRVTYEVKDAA